MRKAACLVVVAFGIVPNAAAQDDFARIRAKLGQRLIVTEGGLTVSGRLTELTATSLKMGTREIEPGPGLKIERDNGNTVAHGMLVGVGVGAALGFVVIGRGGGRPAAAVLGALSGGFWGAIIGESRDRRTTIYDTVSDGPAVHAQLTPPVLITQPATEDFSRVRLKPGQRVVVTERGVTFSGIVTTVTPNLIQIGGRSVSPQSELKIEREGDTLGNGAANGFVAGALAGSTVGAEACLNEPLWHCAVANGLFFAGIGAWIDHRRVGQTTVYDGRAKSSGQRAWHLAPAIGRHTKGVALTRRFR
jgi:outer membrane lipoprotein SlyB